MAESNHRKREIVKAPWTDMQVERLRDWQRSGFVHPYTCGKRHRSTHVWSDWGMDYGVLIPTRKGWVCSDCDYTQDWAHDFSFEPIPMGMFS